MRAFKEERKLWTQRDLIELAIVALFYVLKFFFLLTLDCKLGRATSLRLQQQMLQSFPQPTASVNRASYNIAFYRFQTDAYFDVQTVSSFCVQYKCQESVTGRLTVFDPSLHAESSLALVGNVIPASLVCVWNPLDGFIQCCSAQSILLLSVDKDTWYLTK